jgi:hypothetical protein
MAIPSLASYALASVRHCEMSRHEWLFDVSLRVARKFMRELRELREDASELEDASDPELELDAYTRIEKLMCRIAWTETQAARVQRILSAAETSIEMDRRIVVAVLAHIYRNVDASDAAVMRDTMILALQGARKNRERICDFIFDSDKVDVEWHRRGGWYCTINIRSAKNVGGLMHFLANKNIADILAFWDRLGIFNDPQPFSTSFRGTYRGAPAMWRVWLLVHFDPLTKIDVSGEVANFVNTAFSCLREKRYRTWAATQACSSETTP